MSSTKDLYVEIYVSTQKDALTDCRSFVFNLLLLKGPGHPLNEELHSVNFFFGV